ncbi:MAG TPA: hypothetical protein PLP28_15465, partial [Flavobacteriales bacterium]|nr:hypothetical protein [Flavobacteriales bacterium]
MNRNLISGLLFLGAGSAIALTCAFTNPKTSNSMIDTMTKSEAKSFEKPDEVRTFPKGRLELINIGGATVGRGIFEPGWRWSTSVMPIAKTKSCEAPHFQYHV